MRDLLDNLNHPIACNLNAQDDFAIRKSARCLSPLAKSDQDFKDSDSFDSEFNSRLEELITEFNSISFQPKRGMQLYDLKLAFYKNHLHTLS